MKIINEYNVKPTYFVHSEEVNIYYNPIKDKTIVITFDELDIICDDIKRRFDLSFENRTSEDGKVDIDGILDEFFEIIDDEVNKIYCLDNTEN